MENQDHAAASQVCGAHFSAGGVPELGVLAARADRELGDEVAVLAWGERLRGTVEEPAVLSVIAGLHRRLGRTDEAMEAYRQQVEVSRQLEDPRQEAWGFYGLYYLAWEQSDFPQALLQADQMLEAAERAQAPALAATAGQAIFNLRYDLGDLEGAEEVLGRVESLLGPDEAELRARQLGFRCALELDLGRQNLAIRACEQALAEAPDTISRSFSRSAHLNLVRGYLELDDPAAATPHLDAAWESREPDGSRMTGLWYHRAWLAVAEDRPAEALDALTAALEEDPVPDWVWDLEALRGSAAQAIGDLSMAETAYLRAVEALETLRQDLGADELKPWLLAKRRRPFEELFTLRVGAGRARDALAIAERAQARSFLDAFIVATEPAVARNTRAGSGLEERREILDTLLPSLQASPIVALRPLGEVLAQLEREPLSQTTVLVFFRTGDALWTVTLRRGAIRPRRVDLDLPALQELWRGFARQPGNLELADRLGTLLIPRDALPEDEARAKLMLVTDGELSTIPFPALRLEGRSLVERVSLAQVPSLQALVTLMGTARQAASTPLAPPKVFGDPRGDLPAASEEAEGVAGSQRGTLFVGPAASSDVLFDEERPRLLHLATHSGVDSRGPWLALADRTVTASEILSSGPTAPLVVLASCASGARPGQGVWGSMGGAFLAAGSASVLVSLWSLDDDVTRRFIEHFYALGGRDDPAGALARAQRAAIIAGEPAGDWAPFVLIGLHEIP